MALIPIIQEPVHAPEGRLTLIASTPVMIVDVAPTTTTRYTPHLGDRIPINADGQGFLMEEFTELTNISSDSAVGNAGPAVVVADSNYDLFVWNNGGVLTLTRGPLWTSDTVRSAGTALVRVNGWLVNDVAITNGPLANRGTYVGSVRSDSGALIRWELGGKAVGGDPGFLNVWNMYNRVDVAVEVLESTLSWTYAAGIFAWRAANMSTSNRVSYIVGLAEDFVEANYTQNATTGVPYIGVGFDSVTVRAGSSLFTVGIGQVAGFTSRNVLGFHFMQAIEFNNSGVGVALFWGDIGIPLIAQNGFFFKGKF